MGDWFVNLGYEGQLATWVIASFLLYTLASQLLWHSQWLFGQSASSGDAEDDRAGDAASESWVDDFENHPLVFWLEEAVRFIYYLGVPFFAAVSGLLGADVMGISGTDWVDGQSAQGFLWEDWARGLGLATVTVLALLALWFATRLVQRRTRMITITHGFGGPLWRRVLDVFYLEVHWAFYRSGPLLWLDDLYWGTVAGLGLVVLERVLNPGLLWKLRSPATAGPELTRFAMAGASALLFLATQNLWLIIGAHLVVAVALGGNARERAYAPSIR